MKKSLVLAISLAAMTAGSAFAADLPSHKDAPVYVPPPPPPPMWTGFYGGLNIGGGWTANTGGQWENYWDLGGFNGGFNNHINAGGVVGGGQVGYNYQVTPMFLVGAETDFQGSSIGSVGSSVNWGWGRTTGVNIGWFGTVRGRAGVTLMPTLLIYGTGGFAYADVARNGGWQSSAVQTGWTAGGGVEWMFMPNWSAKAEYLYTEVSGGNQNGGWNLGTSLNNVNNHTRWNTVRAGVNYHFNFGGGAPIIAKY